VSSDESKSGTFGIPNKRRREEERTDHQEKTPRVRKKNIWKSGSLARFKNAAGKIWRLGPKKKKQVETQPAQGENKDNFFIPLILANQD